MEYEIIVVSDSHGRSDLLEKIEKAYPDAYLYLHCGDLEDSPQRYPKWLFVRGNNDWTGEMPDSRRLKIGGHGIYMMHSDRLSYRNRQQALSALAKQNDCDVALYGHTHCSADETVDGVHEINPGSLWLPRDGNLPSYARIVIDDDGNLKSEIIFQDKWPFDPSRNKESQKDKKRFWFWN